MLFRRFHEDVLRCFGFKKLDGQTPMGNRSSHGGLNESGVSAKPPVPPHQSGNYVEMSEIEVEKDFLQPTIQAPWVRILDLLNCQPSLWIGGRTCLSTISWSLQLPIKTQWRETTIPTQLLRTMLISLWLNPPKWPPRAGLVILTMPRFLTFPTTPLLTLHLLWASTWTSYFLPTSQSSTSSTLFSRNPDKR